MSTETPDRNNLLEKMLRRIANLRARAEHPNTPPAEAALCVEQIEKLMARHSIDEAMLDARDTARGNKPAYIEVDLGGQKYPYERLRILSEIGKVFGCKFIYHTTYNYQSNRSTIQGQGALYGFPKDLDMVWDLFDMLDDQAMLQINGVQGGTAVRKGFLLGFAIEVGSRIREVYKSEIAAMEAETGQTGTDLVLANRVDIVEDYYNEKVGKDVKKTNRSLSVNASGYYQGTKAGAEADINLAKMGSDRSGLALPSGA